MDAGIACSYPFAVLWECTRVSLANGRSLSSLLPIDKDDWKQYENFRSWIKNREPMDNRIPDMEQMAWECALLSCSNVNPCLRLEYQSSEDVPTFKLRMDPILGVGDGRTTRFGRAFGGDRFITVHIDHCGSSSKKKGPLLDEQERRALLQDWLESEHFFLGRYWRAVHLRLKRKATSKEELYEVKLFATHGSGLAENNHDSARRGHSCTVAQLVNWFMPMLENIGHSACKIYSRLELGFTKTYPTITFSATQIHEIDDVRNNTNQEYLPSDATHQSFIGGDNVGVVMNDGCSRISFAAAQRIWTLLGKSGEAPMAFQGRIANAKGLWIKMRDPERDAVDPIWIETSKSQRKFQRHAEDYEDSTADSFRTTFDVLDWSGPLSASQLSASLLPILNDRGVSRDAIAGCAREHLALERGEFFESLRDPVSLACWVSERFPACESEDGYEARQGCLPKGRAERIARLAQAGFTYQTSSYLSKLLQKGLSGRLDQLAEKLEVRLPASTSALAVPDFTRTLQPGEVFLAFSQGSPDDRRPCLHDTDVLVGRYPMHRRSDVQRVRAVYCPELAFTRDVIVFPMTGEQPLAHIMSNGDYDGDRYWVCWDENLVSEFQNAPPPVVRPPDCLGISTDTPRLSNPILEGGVEKFLRTNFAFQMEDRILGRCAYLQESFAYWTQSIGSENFELLSDIRDHLVDATKQGYRFSSLDWKAFLKQHELHQSYPLPAYKSKDAKRAATPTDHIIDHLKFQVIIPITKEFKRCAMSHLQTTSFEDHYLDCLYISTYDKSCQEDLSEARENLEMLQDDINRLIDDWILLRTNVTGLQDYDLHIEQAYQKFSCISPRKDDHILTQEWCRIALPSLPSIWSLLKASAIHATVTRSWLARPKSGVTEHFLFALAGSELLFMKSHEKISGPITVIPDVYRAMRFTKRARGLLRHEDTQPPQS